MAGTTARAREIIIEWKHLQSIHGENYEAIQNDLRKWYSSLPRTHPSKKLSRYKWVDKWGPWRDRDISWPGGGGPRYDVPHKLTQKPCTVPEAGWRFATWDEMKRQINAGLVEFRADHTKPPFRKAHLLPTEEEEALAAGDEVNDGNGTEDEDSAGMLVMPSVIHKQAQVAIKLQRKMFNGKQVFPNPKDHEVIMHLIRYVTDANDLILDSFGGSGPTGHAVLESNRVLGGNRHFILVEMDEDICQKVTAHRLRTAIEGYDNTPGLGGGFRFCTLGDPLTDEDGNIRSSVRFRDLAHHVFFTETGLPLPKKVTAKNPLLGEHEGTTYYLLFNGVLGDKRHDGGNVLTTKVLESLSSHTGRRVIYGEGCRLSPARLKRENIVFKQIPYEVKVG